MCCGRGVILGILGLGGKDLRQGNFPQHLLSLFSIFLKSVFIRRYFITGTFEVVPLIGNFYIVNDILLNIMFYCNVCSVFFGNVVSKERDTFSVAHYRVVHLVLQNGSSHHQNRADSMRCLLLLILTRMDSLAA